MVCLIFWTFNLKKHPDPVHRRHCSAPVLGAAAEGRLGGFFPRIRVWIRSWL